MAGKKAKPRVERARPPEAPERLIGPPIVEDFLSPAEVEQFVRNGDSRWPYFGAENAARHRQQSQRDAWIRVTFPELAGAGWPTRHEVLERAGVRFVHGRPRWRNGRPSVQPVAEVKRDDEHSDLGRVLKRNKIAAHAAAEQDVNDGNDE
jgi:hypothetical protein